MILLNDLVKRIFDVVLPIAVLIGFIKVILAGYAMMGSQGDPAKMAEAKEDITAAVLGLLFILFSVAILRIIVVNLITGGGSPF